MNFTFLLCGFSVATVFTVKILKQFHSETGMLIAAAAGILMFGGIVALMIPVLEFIRTAASLAGLSGYVEIIYKSLAVSLLCTLCADICRDCGESGLASRVELGGRVCLLYFSIPILEDILNVAGKLI